jgi:tyrosine-protein kinase Etk/Wzc
MKPQDDIFNNNIDYKKIFNRLYSFRRFYLISFVVLIFLAFLINRYSPVKYKNSTLIYISNDNQNPLMGSSQNDLFQGLGMFSSKNIIDNEVEIIKAFPLTMKVINALDLKTSYFSTRKTPLADLLVKTPLVRKRELYDDAPIKVNVDPSVPQAVYLKFDVEFLNDNEFQIEANGKGISLYNYIDDQIVSLVDGIYFKNRFKFGDEIKTRYFNFRIQKTENFSKDFTDNNKLSFFFNNTNLLTLQIQNNLTAEPLSERATLIKVSLKGNHPQLITDFLNNLSSVYLERSLEKKNKIASSTVDFIDSQISDIADSLSNAESNLNAFRTSRNVMDLSFQGQQAFETLSKLETEKANFEAQRKYYFYLRDYLSSNESASDLLAPSSMNVVDPILTNLVEQLLNLSAERASLIKNNSTNQQNLYISDINAQIENIKKTLKENVKSTLNTLDISLNEISYRISKLSGQISQMPKTELQLKGIERKFKLNDEIYTFLLQKRSEAQIARASSLPDYEIIDTARIAVAGAVSPKRMLNYLIAILLTVILPTTLVLGKDFFNNKFSQPDDIENITKLPILGKIFHSYRRNKIVVNEYPNSSVTECFRAVRTNFQFFSEGGKKQVLLLTSSTSGEGKTYCSMNLAAIFALNGHRTVLLEFDLRRPKIHQEFGSSNMIGISSYLIDKAIIEDIVIPTHIENLDLISAGPAAPNPAELISSERTAEFIDKLKEMYDYIIIDSAPAGILTETYLLMKYADITIFIVRLNKTIKETFKTTLKSLEANKLSNISILINDIDISREAFKYGYDKKYYTDDSHKGFLARIFGKKTTAS